MLGFWDGTGRPGGEAWEEALFEYALQAYVAARYARNVRKLRRFDERWVVMGHCADRAAFSSVVRLGGGVRALWVYFVAEDKRIEKVVEDTTC